LIPRLKSELGRVIQEFRMLCGVYLSLRRVGIKG
jgi:hypothetical protein